MKRSLVLLLTALALFATAAVSALECQGVNFLDQTTVDGTPLTLNGLGLREATVFKVDVYVAALYLKNRSGVESEILDARQNKQLVLHFLRDVGRDDITKAWTEGFEASTGGALSGLNERIATLNGWMTDIKVGERLVFTYNPGVGVRVEAGGSTKGTIEGDDFARAFYGIWLGAKPPNKGLKDGLLGGKC